MKLTITLNSVRVDLLQISFRAFYIAVGPLPLLHVLVLDVPEHVQVSESCRQGKGCQPLLIDLLQEGSCEISAVLRSS